MCKRELHFTYHLFNMKKYCYFCKNDDISDELYTSNNYKDDNYWCKNCKKANGLWSVVTSHRPPNSIVYAHIYIELAPDKKYHIRLHIQEDTTTMSRLTDWGAGSAQQDILIPGIALTPNNIRQKLPLYLIFS